MRHFVKRSDEGKPSTSTNLLTNYILSIMKKLFLSTFALFASLAIFGANDGRSFKRGFGENTLYYVEDLKALLPGNSWYYDWGTNPDSRVADYIGSDKDDKGIEFIPMAWNGLDENKLRAYYAAHPNDKYLLGFNEPNFPDQANMLPSEAAEKWRSVEAFAEELGLKLVAPAMNYAGSPLKDGKVWGPTEWFDAFIAAYKEKYGREPHYDYTAVHAYMPNAAGTLSFVNTFAEKYGKKVWLTEFCSWEANETPESQMKSMIEKVKQLELNNNVYRYAWFKARNANKTPYYNLLYYPTSTIAKGTLTDLGFAYVHMSTFNKEKYYDLNEAIPSNGFIDCNLSNIRQSADPRALDETELYLDANNLYATYQVNVPEDGTYKLVIRYARAADDLTSRIHIIDQDGKYLQKRQDIEATTGWNNYVAKTFDVTLKAGKQTIKIQKASFAPMALSLIKLVKELDANDPDLKTATGEHIDKPDTGGDDDPNVPVTPGENESFDKEVVVSDEAGTFDDNNKYYAIYLDGTTKDAHISADRFVNLGDNGGSQNSYLWENTFSYGDATGKNSFGMEGDYKALVVADKGWSGMGYNVDGSKGDLDLSGINKDYKLHLALKASHNYPLLFTINDGSGHTANLVFGQYSFDGKRAIADFKRDGKWHSIDIPVAYLHKKFGIDFSKDTDYNGNIMTLLAGGKQGLQVNFDAVYFYGPKDGQPDNYGDDDVTLAKVKVSDDKFQFSDEERYYVVYLDEVTQGQNLDHSQIVECGPNGTSRQLYNWNPNGGEAAESLIDNNSFGEPGSYMSWKKKAEWFGIGYNVAGSTTPLNLSGISNDYYLHLAVKTTYSGDITFTVTDAKSKEGKIILGTSKYAIANFARDGKWHNIDVPVNLLNLNNGLDYSTSTNFTGNIFTMVFDGAEGTTVDYDAVFFHGPKSAPAYANETISNKTYSIAKAEEKPFQFSKDETYYAVVLDNITKGELDKDQIVDIGPNESTRFLYPWEDTVEAGDANGENSYGNDGGYTSWVVGSKGWSGLGFSIDASGMTNLTGITKDYSLHFAVKSTTTQPVMFTITDGNGKACKMVLGQEAYDGVAPVGDFKRDNTWYNIDIPVAYLIKQGLDFRTAKVYNGNIISVLCGTQQGQVLDYDNIFFHGPKDKTTGIENVIVPTTDKQQNANIPTEIFDLYGRKVNSMDAPGIYIIRSAAGVKKVLKKS